MRFAFTRSQAIGHRLNASISSADVRTEIFVHQELLFRESQNAMFRWSVMRVNFSRTYVLATVAYAAVVFSIMSLSWWGPTSTCYAFAMNNNFNSTDDISKQTKAQ